jgi:hypothetical protein
MADDQETLSKTKQSKVRMDDFIAKAVPDPKNSGGTQLVSGFIGASPEPEHTRIYWDASLGTYVDVKTADILHSEPLPKEQSPLGGSYIWLKRDGQVSFGSAAGQSKKGKFFEGPLMAAYGGQFGAAAEAGMTPMGGGAPWPYSNQMWCRQSALYPCASHPCSYLECSALCPPHTLAGCATTPNCVAASAVCAPGGFGTPVERQGAQMAGVVPQAAISNFPGCFHSFGGYCGGPHASRNCPMLEPGTVRGGCGGGPRPDPEAARAAAALAHRPTIVDPWCPYPSEICTHGVACHGHGGFVAQPVAEPALYRTLGWNYCRTQNSLCYCVE